MDITVNRTDKNRDGVFGEIPELNLVTLEHAYDDGSGSVYAKVPEGVYLCVRGKHTLPTGEEIETFEVTDVPGHSGILFHPGNKNKDSAGCFLPGIARYQDMVTMSRMAFRLFMEAQEGEDSFMLTVKDSTAHN